MIQVPTFVETLHNCKVMYEFAREDFSNTKFNDQEFSGSLPRRRTRKNSKLLSHVWKKYHLTGSMSRFHVRRMLLASYDQGLIDEYEYREYQSECSPGEEVIDE